MHFSILAASWLTFAFIVTTCYGSNLKASRLNVVAEHPINDIRDVVGSGLQWHMFDYGNFLDYEISLQQGEEYSKFLQDRKVITIWKTVPYQKVNFKEETITYVLANKTYLSNL